jgi:hypothetical protein
MMLQLLLLLTNQFVLQHRRQQCQADASAPLLDVSLLLEEVVHFEGVLALFPVAVVGVVGDVLGRRWNPISML